MRFRFPKVGTLEVSEADFPGQWDVTFRAYRARKPALRFCVNEPFCRTAEYGPVEHEIAAAALSFMGEPSAWDNATDRAAAEEYGETLQMEAMNRRDTLGRVVRRHMGA